MFQSLLRVSSAGVLAGVLGGCQLVATFDATRLPGYDVAALPNLPGDAGVDAASDDVADAARTDADDAGKVTVDAELPDDVADASEGGTLPPLADGVVTIAGSSEGGNVDGVRADARFLNPVNVALGPDGNLYVSDYDNDRLRVVDPEGRVRTLTHQRGFSRPFGLVFTPDGTLYVETDANDIGGRSNETGTLWRVDNDGRATALVRDLGRPRGMSALADGRIVLADPEHHVVRVFDPSDGRVTDLAGERDQPGHVDGTGDVARFNRPYDVARVGDRVVVVDQGNHRLRSVTLDGAVTTFAGDGMAGTVDGDAGAARFNRPQALAVDAAGVLYVTDMDGYVVRRVTPEGAVSTVAGTGRGGFADDVDPARAQFFGLEGMDVSPDGFTLYVADGNRGGEGAYHRVRRVRFPL